MIYWFRENAFLNTCRSHLHLQSICMRWRQKRFTQEVQKVVKKNVTFKKNEGFLTSCVHLFTVFPVCYLWNSNVVLKVFIFMGKYKRLQNNKLFKMSGNLYISDTKYKLQHMRLTDSLCDRSSGNISAIYTGGKNAHLRVQAIEAGSPSARK